MRQCVLEMKKLTFSQLTRFHSGLLNYFKKTPEGGYVEVPLESVKVRLAHSYSYGGWRDMGVGLKGKNEKREGGRELSKEVNESRNGSMEGTRREGG